MPINISPDTHTSFYGVYINDDWKITKNLTLNLGLRYEYESPYSDTQYRLTRALDLSTPIPELQGIAMPDEVKQFYTGSWTMNGAFQFASKDRSGAWDGGWGFAPHGAVYR
jgi:outer membrane receptor protein involved in Fe transport